jgi:hypothetical protein
MRDIISAIRRTLIRTFARHVVVVVWGSDTFMHYTIKRNSADEWAAAYPAEASAVIVSFY